MTEFVAEIIEVKVKKLASGDKSFRVILETDNPQAMQLQRFISEAPARVKVEDE